MKQKFYWIALGITLLGFGLRVFRLDTQSLWWDEIMPILIARLPFPQWFEPVFQDRGYPPGFYLLMTGWLQFGDGDSFSRFVPVFFGTCTIPILAQLGKRVGGMTVGLISAGLMTCSPFFIWYSQEMRMYAPLTFAAVGSAWAFIELVHHPRRGVAFALFGIDLFGLYIHYLFGVFLVTQIVFFAMSRGRHTGALRMWLAATFAAGAFFLPWILALFLVPIQGRPNLAWIPNAQWYDPMLSLYQVLLGPSQDPNFLLHWIVPVLGLTCAVAGVLVAWKTQSRESVRYLLTWLLAPVLFLLVVSIPVPGRSLYVDRYLNPFVPALLVLISLGFVALSRRQRIVAGLLAALVLILIAQSLSSMYFQIRYARDDWRGLVGFLHENADPRQDAVLLDLGLVLPFDLYQQDALARIERPFSTDENLTAWANTASNFRGHTRVWLVTSAVPVNVHRFYPDEKGQRTFGGQDPFKQAMDGRYPILGEYWFPGLVLTKYQVVP